jgi:hypothetical protein
MIDQGTTSPVLILIAGYMEDGISIFGAPTNPASPVGVFLDNGTLKVGFFA